MHDNRIVALIPARGGSKRIPRKNVREIGGHPLIAYSILVGLEVCGDGNVFVSTDDPEISEIAQKYGATVQGLRPKSLSGDASKDIDWLVYEIENLKIQDSIIIILRPTSPLRTSGTVKSGVTRFIESEADSLRAVQKVKEHPGKMWRLKEGMLFPLMDQPITGENTFSQPTQSLEEIWVQNASLEVTTANRVLVEKNLSGRKILGFRMPNYEGFDLNDQSDWILLNSYIASNPEILPKIGNK